MMNRRQQKPLKPVRQLDKIFRRRYVKNTQYYYTNRTISEREKGFILMTQPYKVPGALQLVSFAKFNEKIVKKDYRDRQNRPAIEKDNINLALKKNLAPRVFVPEPEDDVKVVTSIHPEFFSVVEGRKIRPNDDIKRYINDIRTICMKTQELGYNNDMRIAIESDMREEIKIYEKIIDKYKQHVRDFQVFLQEDHASVIAKSLKHSIISSDLQDVLLKLSIHNNDIIYLTNNIFKVEDARSYLRTYKDFLTRIAPMTWRKIHDKNFNNLIPMLKAPAIDIDALIERAREEFKEPEEIELYFEQPNQIISLFDDLELQCRDYLIFLAGRYDCKSSIDKKLENLNVQIAEEEAHFRYFITWLEEKVEFETIRSKDLIAAFFELLNGTFFDSYASMDSMKLVVSVMFVFEAVIGTSDKVCESLVDPLRVIEQMYEDINMELDNLDPTIVNKAKKEYFHMDKKAWQDAYFATTELKRFAELTKSLKKAFDPPAKPDRKVKYDPRLNIGQTSKETLSEKVSGPQIKRSYREDLLFFTEWCGKNNELHISRYLDDYFALIKPVLEGAQAILDI